jgi:hypothetical protein
MMRIPGANVLRMAFREIAKTPILFYRANGRVLDAVGQWVTAYLPSVTVYGSFQAIERSKYVHLGLDLQKNYYYFFIPKVIVVLQRDISADVLGYLGQRYQVESNTQWYGIDGWIQLLCVEIGIDTGAQEVFGFNTPVTTTGNQNFDNGNMLPDPDTQGGGPINE